MTVAPSETFCIYPWIHLYINPDGSVLPCCVADYSKHMGNVRHNSIEQIWNNEKYKSMRQKMMRGRKCEECSGCYAVEAAGNQSTRQAKNKQYSHLINLINKTNANGSMPELTLRHFDVRWSNICNFKCRSCSSTYSSTWAQEDNAQGANKPIHIIAGGVDNDDLYNQFLPHFSNIETFYFAGGEPLLTDKHYDILEHLITNGKANVKIEYNTNLSNLTYKGKSVLELWNKFLDIQVFASLDSYGTRAEYIRAGTDWKLIENNIKQIKEKCPHVKLNSSSVISSFNVNTIPEFLDYLFDNNLFDRDTYSPSFYNIINPSFYSFNILPDNLKVKIVEKLQNSIMKYNRHIRKEIISVINNLSNSNYSQELHNQFLKTTKHYDSIRKQNFLKTFPELMELER